MSNKREKRVSESFFKKRDEGEDTIGSEGLKEK